MNVKCAVSSCPSSLKTTGNGIRYYRFPKDQGVSSVWAVRCDRRDNWNPSTSFICSLHFTDDDYIKVLHPPHTKKLHPDAVPSKNLKLYGWDVDDAPEIGTGTGTDVSDAEDPFIRSMIKTSSRRKAGKSPRPSHSSWRQDNVEEENVDFDTSCHSETELSEAECDTSSAKRKRQRVSPRSGTVISGQNKKKFRKNLYCVVVTCRAKRTKDFHYFPQDREAHQKWLDAIFPGESYHRIGGKRTKSICRRHFTEDDYLDPPSSGGSRRLARGAVPSVNIPICRAEVRLARLKLHLDLFRRKPEERNLSFAERLIREPELYDLYRAYQDEVETIDPARVHVLPSLPANGELIGPGNPAPGDPSFIPKKRLKELELERIKEEKRAAKKAKLEEKYKMRLERQREYYLRKKELRKLLHSNPLAYENLLAEDMKETKQAQKEQLIASRLIKAAKAGNEVQFGDKMAIVAKDGENRAKYKVVIKKVIKKAKRGSDSPNEVVTERILGPAEGAELFRKVISKVDVSGPKRIKFATADKLTKKPNKPLWISQKPIQDNNAYLGNSTDANLVTPAHGTSNEPQVSERSDQTFHVSSAVEDDAQHEQENDDIYGDDHHDDNYDDDDNHRSDCGMETEDILITEELGGPDHCYTTKSSAEEEQIPIVDPFAELQEQLRSMSEEEARMLVKEKMDGYRAVFKQQVAKLRQLLRAQQKADRKFKCVTRILCSSLREQIIKYYGQ